MFQQLENIYFNLLNTKQFCLPPSSLIIIRILSTLGSECFPKIARLCVWL